eukprot:GHVQ01035618.1.p1 GENE.GHVQ01035618.1~~GHVQ01035618.1.p1  ORF type:complete len:199 (-),score=2.90 GHVQ01035618.1:121-717(-)
MFIVYRMNITVTCMSHGHVTARSIHQYHCNLSEIDTALSPYHLLAQSRWRTPRLYSLICVTGSLLLLLVGVFSATTVFVEASASLEAVEASAPSHLPLISSRDGPNFRRPSVIQQSVVVNNKRLLLSLKEIKASLDHWSLYKVGPYGLIVLLAWTIRQLPQHVSEDFPEKKVQLVFLILYIFGAPLIGYKRKYERRIH